MENKIIIGKIVNTIGLKGELRVIVNNSHIERFVNLYEFKIEGFDKTFICEKSKVFGNKTSLKIKDLNDINLVEMFKNHDFYVVVNEQTQLDEDEFFVKDLIGSKIVNGKEIGTVIDVENYGAGDIIVFIENKKEKRVAFNYYYFKEIDVENKVLVASDNFYEGVV